MCPRNSLAKPAPGSGSGGSPRYRNLESLIAARDRYARINVPVTLVYGDEDWSRPSDRQANVEFVPGARDIVLRNKGHFTALEAPDDVARILLDGARTRR
jgi:pimeloyl-ACP methyl ester carboxylesterase